MKTNDAFEDRMLGFADTCIALCAVAGMEVDISRHSMSRTYNYLKGHDQRELESLGFVATLTLTSFLPPVHLSFTVWDSLNILGKQGQKVAVNVAFEEEYRILQDFPEKEAEELRIERILDDDEMFGLITHGVVDVFKRIVQSQPTKMDLLFAEAEGREQQDKEGASKNDSKKIQP